MRDQRTRVTRVVFQSPPNPDRFSEKEWCRLVVVVLFLYEVKRQLATAVVAEARSRQWDIIANCWGEDWVAEAERQEKRAIDNLQNTRIFIVLSCGIFSFVAGGLEASIWSKPARTVEQAAPAASPRPTPSP
jgi:hypothetical protein